MRKIVMMGLLLFTLAGCFTVPQPYGNDTTLSIAQQQELALATVKPLVLLYPPAKIRLNVAQPTTDAYGKALVQALREQGYALQEFAPSSMNDVEQATPLGVDLYYIVDVLTPLRLHRVTIKVGTQSISRVFNLTLKGQVHPKGRWIHKD